MKELSETSLGIFFSVAGITFASAHHQSFCLMLSVVVVKNILFNSV